MAGNFANILYDNLVTTSNITGSSSAAGFPATNAANGLTTHFWKPTALPATLEVDFGVATDIDAFGIAAHDLATQECEIDFQSWNGSSWDTDETVTPSDNKAIMSVYSSTQTTQTKYRISIDRVGGSSISDMPVIGVFSVGEVMVMERMLYGGHNPVTLSRTTTQTTNETEGGQFAGRSNIRQGVATSYEWRNLTPAWMRSTFDAFIVAARDKPFFIQWRPTEYPLEVGYVWTTGDIRPVNNGTAGLMDVSMNVRGYTDE